MNPVVSIILPYRNREDFLPRTLRSMLLITCRPLQLLLIDNNSTDSSPRICRDFAALHSTADFEILNLSEQTGGAAKARNTGIEASAAPYLYFFDSDDVISPTFLDVALQILQTAQSEEKTSIDIVAAPTTLIFPDGKKRVRYTNSDNKLTDQILTGMLSTQSMLLSRKVLIDVGCWDETLEKWNDWELGIRLLAQGAHIHWLDKAYHKLYQHPQSLTAMQPRQNIAAVAQALRKVRSLIGNNPRAAKALAARALILAEECRAAGLNAEAHNLQEEFPLPQTLRIPLTIQARTLSRGMWRTAKFLI